MPSRVGDSTAPPAGSLRSVRQCAPPFSCSAGWQTGTPHWCAPSPPAVMRSAVTATGTADLHPDAGRVPRRPVPGPRCPARHSRHPRHGLPRPEFLGDEGLGVGPGCAGRGRLHARLQYLPRLPRPLRPAGNAAGTAPHRTARGSLVGVSASRLACVWHPTGRGRRRLFPPLSLRGHQHGLRAINNAGRPFAFYLHPWEIDPEQPRLSPGWARSFRHYVNLGRTEERLRRLARTTSPSTP